MTFEFQCQCGKLLSAEEEWVGRNARCPNCSTVLIVPDPNDASSWAAPPAPAPVPQPKPGSAAETLPRRESSDQFRSVSRDRWRSQLHDVLIKCRSFLQRLYPWIQRRKAMNVLAIASLFILLLAVVFIVRHFAQPPQESYAENAAVGESQVPTQSAQAIPVPDEQAPVVATVDQPPSTAVETVDTHTVDDADVVWFRGIRRRIQLAGGEQIGLFLDPNPDGSSADVNQTESLQMLSLIALNDADLLVWLTESQVFSQGVIIYDQPAEDMWHILVFPRGPQPVSEDGATEPFVTFQPGPIRQLSQLTEQFGSADETQLWLGPEARELGITEHVLWWDNVGVSASQTSQITHVFLRAANPARSANQP